LDGEAAMSSITTLAWPPAPMITIGVGDGDISFN